MRIGITYLYTIFRYGYPHRVKDALSSISAVRQLGFRFLEMEGLGAEMLSHLYKKRREFVQVAEDSGVHVHNFCVVDPELVSIDDATRSRALDRFRMGAEIAAMLNSETLHLASYAPPVEYLGAKPYQLDGPDGYTFVNGLGAIGMLAGLPAGFTSGAALCLALIAVATLAYAA
jgi:sugar phosphate isomerase/epimerase